MNISLSQLKDIVKRFTFTGDFAPSRDWLILLSLGMVVLLCVIIYASILFTRVNRDTVQSSGEQETQVLATLKEKDIAQALDIYQKRIEYFETLRAKPLMVPNPRY